MVMHVCVRVEELLAGSASTSRVNHKNKFLLIMATVKTLNRNVRDVSPQGWGQFSVPLVGMLPIFSIYI